MRLRHPTQIALAASLAVHGTLAFSALRFGDWVAIEGPRPTVEAQLFTQPPPEPPDDPFGVRGGSGQALSDFEADDPLRARQAMQDQPLLGLAQHGPLRLVPPTSARLLSTVEPAPPLPPPRPVHETVQALSTEAEEALPPQVQAAMAQSNAAPADAASLRSPQDLQEQAPTDPGAPDGRELDLFSREAFADFRAGRAVAREGREHRIRGLRPGLTAMVDATFIPRPVTVRFRMKVDTDGTPVQIDVTHSTGSRALDETLRSALFNSWFDPDPSGDGSDLGKPFFLTMRIV